MSSSDSPKPLVKQFRSRFNSSLIASAGFLLTGSFTFLLTPSLGVSLFMCGILLGLAAGYFFEQRELGFIEEKGEKESWSPYSSKGRLIVAAAILGILGAIVLGGLVVKSETSIFYLRAFSIFISSLAPTLYITRIWLLKRWQREHQKEIIFEETSILTTRIYLASKNTVAQV